MSENDREESPATGAGEAGIVAGAESSASKKARCAVSGKERPRKDMVRLEHLRPALADRIRQAHPDLADDAMISRTEVNRFRNLYVEDLLKAEHGEFSTLEREVAESIANEQLIAENVEQQFDEKRTLGDRLADGIATFGGSWYFLISFGVVLAVWMAINVIAGATRAFDPYPFILLNLVLSCLAAVQAPIIMMSQRRQEEKDRMRSLNDYQVNLKAELEIRHLHEKVDHLINRQWQRLAEIQQIQMEIMQEARRRR
ncbi:Uncharacterized membrane protein [Faunimonas pinastri]|uniref:Uncharacterized membrane protein n=1 Tax=Faunimonas pinastri TaxID=1855383 RepID=A0A1H9AB75_9HYPH|nr:DUF1003 domain-containing protein [Faunimonas pinastri]SEP73248.1 Uncharacterized membrane protein [Faunimonas pinastri]